jgi:hypothetical protein
MAILNRIVAPGSFSPRSMADVVLEDADMLPDTFTLRP